MSRIFRLVALSFTLLAGVPAFAAEYHKSGDWVFHSSAFATDGDVTWDACVASTTSMDGTELTLRLEPAADGFEAVMGLTNDGWSLGAEAARIRLDIGSGRWMLQGEATGAEARVAWTGDAAILPFLEDFASSSFAVLMARDGATVSQFSLRGSRKAIEAMTSCVEAQIGQGLAEVLAAAELDGNPF